MDTSSRQALRRRRPGWVNIVRSCAPACRPRTGRTLSGGTCGRPPSALDRIPENTSRAWHSYRRPARTWMGGGHRWRRYGLPLDPSELHTRGILGRPALPLLAEMLTGRGPFNWMLLVCLAMLVACRPLSPGGNDGPHLTHGIAAGEVTATSAVVWGRCDRATALRVQLGAAEHSTDVTTATD